MRIVRKTKKKRERKKRKNGRNSGKGRATDDKFNGWHLAKLKKSIPDMSLP